MKAGKIALMGVMVVLLTMLTGCGYNVPSDMVAVHVGEGPFEAKKVKGCIEPSKRAWLTNDTYALFPNSEREWDATGQKGSDSGRFRAVTEDNVEMYVPVTVRFTLVTECDTLMDFYTRYARRYGVEFNNDGEYNDEWIVLLRKLVADPADATLDRIVQGYKWRDVWNDPATKVALEKAMNDNLSSDTSLLTVTAKGKFFEGISVLIGKPQPVNPDLAEAVSLEQTNVAKAQSAEAQANADRAKALAEVAVSKAEAMKKEAEIKGYGGLDGYLKALCITTAENCNPWQPTYVVGGTTK